MGVGQGKRSPVYELFGYYDLLFHVHILIHLVVETPEKVLLARPRLGTIPSKMRRPHAPTPLPGTIVIG